MRTPRQVKAARRAEIPKGMELPRLMQMPKMRAVCRKAAKAPRRMERSRMVKWKPWWMKG